MASSSPRKRQKTGGTQFEQLAAATTIVADTGDVDSIKQYKPTDATTNPSLIFKAAQMPAYKHLVEEAITFAKKQAEAEGMSETERMELALDKLCVNFGVEITKIVPGYVSTEVDARLSYDVEGSVRRALRIIAMYKKAGVPKTRILIKLATTWEGIQAAVILKEKGIACNMTLLFAFCQAAAAAEAGVRLISPFVGRIMDWYKKDTGRSSYPAEEDPGVLSVRRIYNYYKTHGYETIVMGASFRNKEQITALAGCDRLTIGPKFLDQLSACSDPIEVKLTAAAAKGRNVDPKVSIDEKKFRWMLNQNPMATEKLAEGIRKFAADIVKLENIVRPMF